MLFGLVLHVGFLIACIASFVEWHWYPFAIFGLVWVILDVIAIAYVPLAPIKSKQVQATTKSGTGVE